MSIATTTVEVNGRRYRAPDGPTAVICLDGLDPAYLEDAFERRLTPRLAELADGGAYLRGRSQLPSFTNPNNLSIVTGAPASIHGVPGNHHLDAGGVEVQLDRPEQLRAPSIQSAFANAGVSVLAVTTKDKLRRLLSANGVPCVSAEHADAQSLAGVAGPVSGQVARPKPDIYDWDCSHYALELALALATLLEVELLYVSLTDSVQHAAAPGDDPSDRYLVRLDELVGEYVDAGWRLGLVADHGMNAKTRLDGSPNVRYLGDLLARAGVRTARVVLPITDPYVAHHAALGSACWVHVDEDELEAAADALGDVDGVEEILRRDVAAAELELPPDRIGDLVVLGDRHTVFGRREGDHDLSALRGPLRSHGGRHEQAVPILLSTPLAAVPALPPANADVHHLLLGAEP
jgi:phosphonoacetate hydrolase